MPLQSPEGPNKSLVELEQDREANLFAFSLLMPEFMLRESVRQLCPYGLDLVEEPAIRVLASKYLVNEQMMIIRLCQLGYFNI